MRNIEMSYYNVYYYCNIIDNLLHLFTESIDWAATGAQFTDPFFEGEDNTSAFCKYSVLHQFCDYAIRVLLVEDAHVDLERIQEKYDELTNEKDKFKRLEIAFKQCVGNIDNHFEADRLRMSYGIKTESVFDFIVSGNCECMVDDYDEYIQFDPDLDTAIENLTRELFYVLFQNRDFLYRFNYYMARANPSICRRSNIPQWVKRAVKYRDRGKCVCCGVDLSGTLDCEDEALVHFDHIIPLREGGLNDVSNIQLLCQRCNLKKSTDSYTSNTYKDWYDF